MVRSFLTALVWLAFGALVGLVLSQLVADFLIKPADGMSVADYSAGISATFIGVVAGAFAGGLTFAALQKWRIR